MKEELEFGINKNQRGQRYYLTMSYELRVMSQRNIVINNKKNNE